MNHFRTSTPVPVYDTGPEVTTALAPAAVSHSPVLTCVQDSLLSPCNPHLPSFSLSDLSQLASLELPPADLGPRAPSQLLPPSGRVPSILLWHHSALLFVRAPMQGRPQSQTRR